MTRIQDIRAISMAQFDYPLSDERIARFPVEPRDASRLLVYRAGEIQDSHFYQLPEYLPASSLLVYNNTRVIHARLVFYKETGARIEIFCLEPLAPADYAQNFQSTESCEWLCLVGNSKKWKEGPLCNRYLIDGKKIQLEAEKMNPIDNAYRIRFTWRPANPSKQAIGSANNHSMTFAELLEKAGHIPIPPYLEREAVETDETNYQTVYSHIDGSVAAPTAGLHFTDKVLNKLDAQGVRRREVTLHVGAGTFQPVQGNTFDQHTMHAEFISVDTSLLPELIASLGQITAVGTTTVRTLETLYWFGHRLLQKGDLSPEDWHLDQWYAYKEAEAGHRYDTGLALETLYQYLVAHHINQIKASTRLLIAPGYTFHLVNALITNFHQPKSTLLLLVSAFLGDERWKTVYSHALAHGYRFLSYGDSSLLIP